MDFRLSDEQLELQNLAREFTANEITPHAAHHDKTAEFPREILRKAWDLGLMNIKIPDEFGGLGLGSLEEVIISEEVAYGCSGMGVPLLVNNLAEAPVLAAGTKEQKEKYLRKMTQEFLFAAYAVTEPGAGSDVAGIQTRAKKVGNDWVINGSKMWITGASVANWFFVLTVTDPDKGHKGMTAFIVDGDTPGLTVGKKEDNLGQRASDTRAVTFADVKVPAENMLGKEGEGFKVAMAAFDRSRPGVAALAVGLARCALDRSVEYARERKTFGQAIWKHQGLSFMIADMARNTEAARLLTYKAAWLLDRGERNTLNAAFAKSFAADMAMEAAVNAVQVHGGYGYSKEYPVEKLMRDAKVIQIYEGTSQIQKLIMVKELFERPGR